ncbi:hypothetical protein VKT23_012933 [Stygiomarasmius scandens]|uniref:Period n=1 Tax=Marasmiellus scandens TaxID=2682957 RepID=A0ABR1JA66_9AGAR
MYSKATQGLTLTRQRRNRVLWGKKHQRCRKASGNEQKGTLPEPDQTALQDAPIPSNATSTNTNTPAIPNPPLTTNTTSTTTDNSYTGGSFNTSNSTSSGSYNNTNTDTRTGMNADTNVTTTTGASTVVHIYGNVSYYFFQPHP